MKGFSLIILLSGTCLTNVFSQVTQQVFSKLSVEDGLSSATVTSIAKDNRGYMWFGTKDGLNRYDGYEFRIYRNKPGNVHSLVRNWILSVFEDSNGTIWASTFGGGLHYYDRNKDHFIRTHFPGNTTINKMIEDTQRRVWFAGNALLCYDLEKGSWVDYSSNLPGIFNKAINGIAQEKENEFWISTDVCIYKWNLEEKSLQKLLHDPPNENALGSKHINTILRDNKDNLWIATAGAGLARYHVPSGSFKHYSGFKDERSGPLVNVVRTLCLDGNFLWVGTENGGLSKLDTRTDNFVHYYREKNYLKGLSDNSIWSLYKDKEGRLWIGTFSFGICTIDPYQNKFSTLKLPFENTVVNSILKDSKKRLWLGTEGGVMRMEGDTFKHYLNKANEKSKIGIPILNIYEDSAGKIWVGTWNEGVYQYDEQNDTFILIAAEGAGKYHLSNGNNYSIIQSPREKDILIASYNGLNIMTENFRQEGFIKLIDSIGNYIRVLFEDSNGNIWVGSHTEMRLYNSSKRSLMPIFYNIKDESKNLHAAIACIYEDTKRRLWVGTDAGLYVIESFAITNHYTMNDGLANQDIRGIEQDINGNIWCSTNTGISMIDPETKAIRNYDATDGIFSNGFKGNSSFKDQDNLIYFGGSDGVVLFDPSTITDNPYPPRVVLSDLKIFNKPVEIDALDSILDRHISETKEVVLNYNANMITIDFVGLNFSASNKNHYAYQLKGFDEEWNYVGKTRSATYTNLAPGSYVLYVKSSNNDGVWSKPAQGITLRVLPPWWNTPGAYFFYAILFLTLLYFFRKLILMRAHFVNDIKMERVKLENVEKLNQTKLNFFTNISHEFRTPLTIIMGLIENMDSSPTIDHIIKSKLHAANVNASRLLRLVNELLDFRKAETGNMKLKVAECNIVAFTREVKLSFEPLAEEKKISFSFHAPTDNINVWIDIEQFEKVLYNLLSNAFKNTPAEGKISMFIRNNIDTVVVTVQDNGKGIKPEFINSIFETFFSVDGDQRARGSGIGLALTKSIVELHHGRIEVESIQNTLTRFNIILLCGKDHFKPHQITEAGSPVDNLVTVEGESVLFPEPLNELHEIFDKKLLIVEDNDEVRFLLSSIFGKHYQILQAVDGVSGWDIAVREIPDLVISDVMMPNKDGIALCKDLKSNIATSHIPVILLTARASLVYQLEGFETGADDYVTKPFNSSLLLLKVRNLIRLRENVQKAFSDLNVLRVEPTDVTVNSRDQLFIEKVLGSVESNMANVEYGVEDLCLDVGMSKTTLFRKLKAVTGQSANEFIKTIRLKRAAQLLPQHELAISEIAYMVGFNDPKYFRVCFKKLFKVCPSEYSHREAGTAQPHISGAYSNDEQ